MTSIQIMSTVGLPAGFIQNTTVAMVTSVMKNTPVAPRLPLNTLSDIQPHSRVPGIPAYSYRK